MQQGQLGGRSGEGRLNMPFVGIPSFLRSVIATDLGNLDADIAVMGVPTDEGSPFMPGARFGPRGIREHSMRFGGGGTGYYDPRERRKFLEHEMTMGRLVDVGDADILPTNVVDTFHNITDMTKQLLDSGAMPVVLGGDHAISYPVVRAYADVPLHVFHFDAHIDYSPFIHGLENTNGHAFRHIAHMPHVQSLTQVGIRSLRHSQQMIEDSLADGNRVVGMEEFYDQGKSLIESLPKNAKVYVSLDIDVLDLPLVPGCVSAEPNGMSYADLRDTLIALAEHTEIVGFDLVEVNPQLDVGTGITSYLAAHTIIEFLGRICDQPRWIARRDERAAKREAVANQE